MKVVLDTNVLIGGFDDEYSASAKLMAAIRNGDIQAVRSTAIEREYKKLMRRLIKDDKYRRQVDKVVAKMEEVESDSVDVIIDDEEDLKFVEAAVAGEVDLIVTSDRHLLDIGEVDKVKIVTPREAWHTYEDEEGEGSWQKWGKILGFK